MTDIIINYKIITRYNDNNDGDDSELNMIASKDNCPYYIEIISTINKFQEENPKIKIIKCQFTDETIDTGVSYVYNTFLEVRFLATIENEQTTIIGKWICDDKTNQSSPIMAVKNNKNNKLFYIFNFYYINNDNLYKCTYYQNKWYKFTNINDVENHINIITKYI